MDYYHLLIEFSLSNHCFHCPRALFSKLHHAVKKPYETMIQKHSRLFGLCFILNTLRQRGICPVVRLVKTLYGNHALSFGLEKIGPIHHVISAQFKSFCLSWYGGPLVPVEWRTLKHPCWKVCTGFRAIHPDILFTECLDSFIKAMSSQVLLEFTKAWHWSRILWVLNCHQPAKPFTNWKHLAHFPITNKTKKARDYWAVPIL